RPLDLAQTRRLHPAALDQPRGGVAVDPRPAAARAARREALEEPVAVERLALPVDPAPAERDLEHVRVADARDSGALLRELHPHAGLVAVVPGEPPLPRRPRAEREDGGLSQGAARAAPSGRGGGSRPRP